MFHNIFLKQLALSVWYRKEKITQTRGILGMITLGLLATKRVVFKALFFLQVSSLSDKLNNKSSLGENRDRCYSLSFLIHS